MDLAQRCFGIEREGDLPIRSSFCPLYCGLASFTDEFVFFISTEVSNRYSLAEDKWEELPMIRLDGHLSACSLGDKVYVLHLGSRAIKVFHNPDSPVSLQKMHWQEIKVPLDFPISCYYPAFATLNSTEIVIAGG